MTKKFRYDWLSSLLFIVVHTYDPNENAINGIYIY